MRAIFTFWPTPSSFSTILYALVLLDRCRANAFARRLASVLARVLARVLVSVKI